MHPVVVTWKFTLSLWGCEKVQLIVKIKGRPLTASRISGDTFGELLSMPLQAKALFPLSIGISRCSYIFSDSQVLSFYVSCHSYKMLMISFKQSVKLKSHTIYII